MKKLTPILVALVAALLLSGCFALAEPEAASGTAVAPTLAAAATEAAPLATAAEQSAPATATPPAAYPAAAEPQVPDPPQQPVDYPAADTAASVPSAGTPVTFVLDPARSEARFIINEVLRGAPTTVVGTTSNLAGQMLVDLNNPASAEVGEIVINARDLKTDNNFRNNAIANQILRTNQFENITFAPSAINGLPQAAVAGESYPVQISGDLTITDQTRPVTFDTTITVTSPTELSGQAAVTIAYADFGITIPFARQVESVEDTVVLELDFTALAQ